MRCGLWGRFALSNGLAPYDNLSSFVCRAKPVLSSSLVLQIANRLLVVDELRDGRVVTADGAILRVRRELDFAEFHRERIVGEQVAREQVADTENVLDGFHCLQTTDNTAHSADHASLLASRHGIFRRRFLEYAAVARALARNVCHELTLEADNARVRERLFGHDACVVDEELCRKVVGKS